MDARSGRSSSGNPIVQGVELISTRQLPDRLRMIYPFPLFNAVQSKCFNAVYNGDDNFVLSAPTGSGKTAVLELAICRLLARSHGGEFKVVYQAPTKSLCAERQKDWQAKFSNLGLKCAELTGDTDYNHLRQVQTADILVTTPEKWDSMTRKWKDHRKLMELVKLFLIDEVHILKDDRGACLEAIVSRMQSVGSNIRFVALSATVPNSEDIACWLGLNSRIPGMPAAREVFGEEFRPVRLTKHVYGIQANGMNDFVFDKACNKYMPEVIKNFSARKPIMIFCMTRKSTQETARLLADWWSSEKQQDRCWKSPIKARAVRNDALRDCMHTGVAFHHAGLDQMDRAAVEEGYLAGEISVICCTSTLAVGVNLPCHLVLIKNTVAYQAEGCKEYSDLEVMQMLGRAGRPQYDTTGVAVIMTRSERVDRYRKMVSGNEILESKLHLNLIEHLNAEIGLGTIHDLPSAKLWLKGTFLFVRFRKNPNHYQLSKDKSTSNVEAIVHQICVDGLDQLRHFSLINESPKFSSTEFGDAMARYYVQFETMKLFMGLQNKARISEILSAIAQASEFKSIRFRSGEKQMFKEINASPSIKYPIKVDLALGPHKISLMVQATLGGLDMRSDDRYSNHSLQFISETSIIFNHVHRLIRCIIDCQIHLEDSIATRNALELSRSLGARAWDDSPLQLQQIDNVGPVAVRKLVSAGIRTIEELEETDSQRIDMVLSRNPPFGSNLLRNVSEFPKLRVSLKMINYSKGGNSGVRILVEAELGFLNALPPKKFRNKDVSVIILTETSDGHLVHFCKMSAQKVGNGQSLRFDVDLIDPQQLINCYASCDDIAGTQRRATLNPVIPASAFNVSIWSKDSRMTLFQKHPTAGSRPKNTSTGSEDFGIDELTETDLMAAVNNEFEDIDEVDSPIRTGYSAKPSLSSKTIAQSNRTDIWRPTRLSNGNWACNHACKDKQNCKHLCCRDGLEKPPKRPKGNKSANTDSQTSSTDQGRVNDFFAGTKHRLEESEPKRLKTPSNTSKRRITSKEDLLTDMTDDAFRIEPCEIDDATDHYSAPLNPISHNSTSSRPSQTYKKHSEIFFTQSSSPDKNANNPIASVNLAYEPEIEANEAVLDLRTYHGNKYGAGKEKRDTAISSGKRTHEAVSECSYGESIDFSIGETEDAQNIGLSPIESSYGPISRSSIVHSAFSAGLKAKPSKHPSRTAPFGYGPVSNARDAAKPSRATNASTVNTVDLEMSSTGDLELDLPALASDALREIEGYGTDGIASIETPNPNEHEPLDANLLDFGVESSKVAQDSNQASMISAQLQERKKETDMNSVDKWVLEQFGDLVEFV